MKRRLRKDNATPGARSETAPCEIGAGVNRAITEPSL